LHLLSSIKPSSAEAYTYAYDALFKKMSKDIQGHIKWAKEQADYEKREVKQFFKDVMEIAEYVPTEIELKRWIYEESREKIKGKE
jgi:hypothetical protein